MLQHAELFNVPRWALIVRLPFQVALLALILWSTWTPRFNVAGRLTDDQAGSGRRERLSLRSCVDS